MAKGRVKSLDEAAMKWEEKTSGSGSKWKSNVTAHEADYCSNFSKFVGHNVSKACKQYNEGVDGVSAQDFDSAVKNKGIDYIKGLQQVQ